MDAPQTDSEKIAWLWSRRDEDNARIVALEGLVTSLEAEVEQRDEQIASLRAQADAANMEVARMARELNEARAAAANAVREYISSTSA